MPEAPTWDFVVDAAKKLTPIFPDQDGFGTHVNVSGGGLMASAPHKAIGVKFLEFMAGDIAQNIIAGANYEFPAVDIAAPARSANAPTFMGYARETAV